AILAGVVVTAMLAGCGVVPRAEQVLGHADDTRSDRTPGATPAPAPSGVSKDLQRHYRQRLTWEPCDEGSTLQCTTLRVPLDYDNPGGKSIELAVLRYPAQDQERKLGSLVINPGGPGGSGVEYAAVAPFVI